ncbi:ABC transporter substrate-binding protein [Actinomadura sp. NPDC047616]|uniref:ABC transporter substrate-binding protein n=1 Tax=Actinomadura sp. NPDC047616 TaxID=3155914 RepID=UPI0033E0D328
MTGLAGLTAAAALALGACAAPNPSAAAGTVVVAGYGGSYQEAFEQSVIPGFEKSCGCKVTYIAGSSTDTVAKLKAQAGRPQIDVALIDDGPQAQAAQAGLLAKLDPARVTRLPQVAELARLPGDVGVGFGLTATGIAYNPDWFAENGLPEPTSLEDLASPKLKDKVVLPSITNTYGVHLLVMAAKAGGGSEKNIQPGFDVVRRLAANAVTFDNTADVSNYFLQGQAAASVWGKSRVETLADKNFPIKFVYPKEGAVPLLATANVVNKAPHPDLAARFVNELLGPEAQKKLAQDGYDGPTVKSVQLDPALRDKVVNLDRAAELTRLDWATVNAGRSAWTDTWNKRVEA